MAAVCRSLLAFFLTKQHSILFHFRSIKSIIADSSSLAPTSTTTASAVNPSLAFPSTSYSSVSQPSQTIDPNTLQYYAHAGHPQSHSPPPVSTVTRLNLVQSPSTPSYPLDFPPTAARANQQEVLHGRRPEVEVSSNQMLNNILHDPLFLQWLRARRAWMINQGCDDPLLIGPSVLAQLFDAWLRKWWPLFHSLALGVPATNPYGWVNIFDFWFVTVHSGYISSPSPSQTTPADASATPTVPYQAPAMVRPASAFSANRRHYRHETSTLTVGQIQDRCTIAGGEVDAIARLAAVFPPDSAVARDTLTVGRKPRGGHRGYQEFTGLRDGRWYCRLCGAHKWKNEKEILNHVWNAHCDPPHSD